MSTKYSLCPRVSYNFLQPCCTEDRYYEAKTILAILLTCIMLLQNMSYASAAQQEDTAAADGLALHEHPICGAECSCDTAHGSTECAVTTREEAGSVIITATASIFGHSFTDTKRIEAHVTEGAEGDKITVELPFSPSESETPIRILLARYDDRGRMIRLEQITVSENKLELILREEKTKVYFLDDLTYRPLFSALTLLQSFFDFAN